MRLNRLALLALLLACAVLRVSAQTTPLIRCAFDDTLPQTCAYDLDGGAGTSDMTERAGSQQAEQAGTCGDGSGWQYDRFANGGKNNGAYHLFTLCDWNTVDCTGGGAGTCQIGVNNSFQTGYAYDPPTTHTWPRTSGGLFFRMRVYFPDAWSDPNNDQIKWFIWNVGSGSSNRVMMLIYSGLNCGGTSSQVSLWLTRNNFTDAGVCLLMNTDQWYDVQFQALFGDAGSSVIRGWLNNNVQGSPTAEDTTIYAGESGPSTWESTDANLNGAFDWGNRANEGTDNTEDFPIRWMELEIDNAFDPAWGDSAVATPGGTRIRRVPDLEVDEFTDRELLSRLHPTVWACLAYAECVPVERQ